MVGRLSLEKRRAQIIATTRRMIAEHGPEGLSMRAVARACQMTGPGVAHHFPSMTELLTAVLEQKDREDEAAIVAEVMSHGDEASLLLVVDTFIRYFSDRAEETRNFDRLEAEAMSPAHPAHPYFAAGPPRARQLTRRLAERDYVDPDAVIAVLSLVIDGLRSRWLLEPEEADLWADWVAIRAPLFNGFRRKDGKPTVTEA